MGRYTTVQTISDKDAQGAAVAYEAVATGAEAVAVNAAPKSSSGDTAGGSKPHMNRVDNVSGSSAGAGSGDFHTYRASRRRQVFSELERVEAMEQRYKQNKAQREFDETRKRKADELEAKMHKRAEKRRRRKERAKAKALDGEQEEEEKKEESNADEKEKAAVPETPGGVPEIPNDGSFLEKMLAMQKQKEKIEGK